MSSTAKRLIKNTGWLYAKMGITMVISLYTTRLILYSLGASDFGIFNIVGGAISMLGFLYAAMSSASQRFLNIAMGAGNQEQVKQVFNVSALLHIGFAVIFAIGLIIAGFFFFNGILNIPENRRFAAIIVYCSLIISTSFTVMTVPYSAVMNAHENMKYFALVGIFESLLKLSVAIGCGFTSNDKLIFYGVLMAMIPIINMLIMRIYCHNKYEECRLDVHKYFKREVVNEMFGYAGWSFLTSISSMIGQYGMGIVINNFFGVLLNAAQGIANQVSGVLITFSSNAMKALNPILVKSEGAKNRERVQYLALFGCRLSFFIICFFALPMISLAPLVLNIWLKEVPDWAIFFCQLQLVRIILEQLTSSLASSIYATGKIKHYTIWKSIFNVLPIFIAPCLFYYGANPAYLYYTWIGCWNIIGGIIVIFYAWKLVGIIPSIYVKQILFPAALLIMIYFGSYYIISIINNCTEGNPFSSIISFFFYIFSSVFLIFKKEERKKLKQIVSERMIKA